MTSGVSLKTLTEAGEILGVSYFTVRRLVLAGHLSSVNIGARIMVSEAEIFRVASQGTGPRRGAAHRPEAAVAAR